MFLRKGGTRFAINIAFMSMKISWQCGCFAMFKLGNYAFYLFKKIKLHIWIYLFEKKLHG